MAEKPVTNVDDVEPINFGNGGRFEGEFRWISQGIGAEKLGYNHVVLPPGKTSFPYHYHRAIEEAFFILEGTGVLRYDGEEYPLRAGDAVACPVGRRSAHQITNNSDADLKYLAISNKPGLDIVHYPDSGKTGAISEPDPSEGDEAAPFRRFVLDDTPDVDYWEGED